MRDDIEKFTSAIVSEPKTYVNLGLTLAAAFSWVEAGKQLIIDLKLGGKGAYIQAILMTLLAIIVLQITRFIEEMRKKDA